MKKTIAIGLICLVVSLASLVNNSTFSAIQNQSSAVHVNLTHQATHLFSMDVFDVSNAQYLATEGNDTLQLVLRTTINATYDSNFTHSFANPYGVAISNITNQIYVSDSENHRIVVFAMNGTYVSEITLFHSTPNPLGLLIEENTLYVANGNNNSVLMYDINGTYLSAITGPYGQTPGDIIYPIGIAVKDNKVFFSDENNRINVFDKNGTFLSIIGSYGSEDGQLDAPKDLYLQGNLLFVADSSNNRIQVFDINGTYLYHWGTAGTGNGEFAALHGICVQNSIVYATDVGNDRIQVFTTNGTYLGQWGIHGTGDGEFYNPKGLTTENNYIYIADMSNNRIEVFSTIMHKCLSEGSYISPIVDIGADDPYCNTIAMVYAEPDDAALDASIAFSADNVSWSGFSDFPIGNYSMNTLIARYFQFYINFSASTDFLDTPTFTLLEMDWNGTMLNEIPQLGDIAVTFDNETMEATISGYVTDPDNDTVDVFFCLPLGEIIANQTNVLNGTIVAFLYVCEYNSIYEFYLNVTDSENSTQRSLFNFSTGSEPTENQLPLIKFLPVFILFGIIAIGLVMLALAPSKHK